MMKQILLFGAGKSATVLIDYLLKHAANGNWVLTIADANLELAKSKIGSAPGGRAVSFDILDEEKRRQYIQSADVVISMLPPTLHAIVAIDCVAYGRHLLTASYIDSELRAMQDSIREKEILVLCEMGLDPGIDHMSAMQLIDTIHANGGEITMFQSHCGGLVAPESDDNPWHYKISWNPRNIIMAGKAGAHYRLEGAEVRLTHEQLFSTERIVDIPGHEKLAWYPNRDSLSYESVYGLRNVPTFVRTTLRHPGFMTGWSKIISLDLTDETPAYESNGRSMKELFDEHIKRTGHSHPFHPGTTSPAVIEQLTFLGFQDAGFTVDKGLCSAADLLQIAAEKKLALQLNDRDMIVMLHEFGYNVNGQNKLVNSSLVVKGENSLHTAMAKTVGLPLGIAAKLILEGKISLRGLHIPTSKEIYEPVLRELACLGVSFKESLVDSL